MNILPSKIVSPLVLSLTIVLAACSGDSTQSSSESSSDLTLAKDTPIAYVERGVDQTASSNQSRFEQARISEGQTPLELYSPYLFNPGAKLVERSGLDVNAVSNELLTDYFQSSIYDVKDLNVSPDGNHLIFAAHGPIDHPTDYTWNIYEYDFETKSIRRVIEDNALANEGQDTNPTYALNGNIVFSSDRNAGNPDSPVLNVVPVGDEEFCYKVNPKERPSLLHSMTDQGENILQLTYGINHDTHPTTMKDGRITFVRTSFTYDLAKECLTPSNKSLGIETLLAGRSDTPFGLGKPEAWSEETRCAYSESTPIGRIIPTVNYTLLRITPAGDEIEQLYKTVSVEPSSQEVFVSIDRIVQAENGRLVAVLKHKFNDALGGDILEFQSPTNPTSEVFGNVAPNSLVDGGVGLYPDQLSRNGWYSALWPYRDGSNRLLVSWSQCITNDNGVNGFCENVVADNSEDSQYGIWVYDVESRSRLPIVRASNDKLYEDVAMSRPHTGLEFPFEAYNPNYVDNLDDSQVICNFPEPVNTAPIANAGADQAVYNDNVVALDGSASTDVDGDTLTYYWTVVSQPQGSSATLDDARVVAPSFTADRVGTYTFQLVVNDGEYDSEPDTVSIVSALEVVNAAPTANAGVDQQALVGNVVTLDGSGSSDPNGDPLTYQWSVISPAGVDNSIFSDRTSVSPTFDATLAATYVVQLVVNDGQLSSAPDTASIVVNYPNRAPVAEAGNNQQLAIGSAVILNGSGSSDPDGDALTYQWSLVSSPAGSGAALSNASTLNPGITVDEYGSYVIQLIVNDGVLSSAPDTVTLEVVNGRPVANAGTDIAAQLNDTVALDGSASYDPESSPLTYAWVFTSVPDGSAATLSNATSVSPAFVADVEGSYVAQLIVNDGLLDSDPDSVSIEISYDANTAPVADAGDDQKVSIGGTFMLDGSRSSDVDGDALTYQWTVISPSGVSLNNPTSVRPTIDVSQFGSYEIQLIVNDGQVDSQPDTVNLEFDNVKPIANAGPDQSVAVGGTVLLDGSGSTDVNGDPLTYSWQIVDRPDSSSAALTNSQSVNPSFVADQQGTYIIQLVVNDGLIDSDPDLVVITSPNTKPVADAGNDAAVSLGSNAQLDGSGSSDADGDTLTYQWSLLSAPGGSLASLTNSTTVNPTLQGIDIYGDYVVQLVVNDGTEDSLPDTVVLSSQNLPPIADAGNDINTDVGLDVSLDGSGSSDPQGDPITYSWDLLTVPAGSGTTLSNTTSVTPTLTPDLEGLYVAQLIVNDGQFNSTPDTVKVLASNVSCQISSETERTFPVTIRDFTPDHADFEGTLGLDPGIVEEDLGPNGLPVYAHAEVGTLTTNGQFLFDKWYRDSPGINHVIPTTLTMTRLPGSVTWQFSDDTFFPIDDGNLPAGTTSWGNTPEAIAQGLDHNFHFTLETHLEFDYQGGETFTFRGDDDLWVFINGKRAIDLGGVHLVEEATINLDDIATYLGIEPGNTYTFDLFFAERHLVASNFHFETSINLDCLPPE